MAKNKKSATGSSPEKILKLKPGNHQFVPGVHSFHNNENTSSDELKFYLKAYPHIASLIEADEQEQPEANTADEQSEE